MFWTRLTNDNLLGGDESMERILSVGFCMIALSLLCVCWYLYKLCQAIEKQGKNTIIIGNENKKELSNPDSPSEYR